MKYTVRRIRLEALYETLQGLGYHPRKVEGRRSEWRKGSFHLHTYPWAKRGVRLSLHKDVWKQPPPNFKHKAVWKGEDLKQELQKIQQKYSEKQKHT